VDLFGGGGGGSGRTLLHWQGLLLLAQRSTGFIQFGTSTKSTDDSGEYRNDPLGI